MKKSIKNYCQEHPKATSGAKKCWPVKSPQTDTAQSLTSKKETLTLDPAKEKSLFYLFTCVALYFFMSIYGQVWVT